MQRNKLKDRQGSYTVKQ